MRKTLDVPFGPPDWPEDVYLTGLTPDAAAEVHALLDMAYSGGQGTVAPFSEWWASLRSDAEFDPSLIFWHVTPRALLGWRSAGPAAS